MRGGALWPRIKPNPEQRFLADCSKVGVGDGTLLIMLLPVDEALYPLMHVILVS